MRGLHDGERPTLVFLESANARDAAARGTGSCRDTGRTLRGAGAAQLPAAQLHALFPCGGRQGTIVDVKLAGGSDTEGADRLVFSHPHITAVQKTRPAAFFEQGPQPVPNEFTVAIHPDVPPGIYEARYAGRFGVSNPRAFVVGNLPERNEPADNHVARQGRRHSAQHRD